MLTKLNRSINTNRNDDVIKQQFFLFFLCHVVNIIFITRQLGVNKDLKETAKSPSEITIHYGVVILLLNK